MPAATSAGFVQQRGGKWLELETFRLGQRWIPKFAFTVFDSRACGYTDTPELFVAGRLQARPSVEPPGRSETPG